MYNSQTNGARFIYTLSACIDANDSNDEDDDDGNGGGGSGHNNNEIILQSVNKRLRTVKRNWCVLKNSNFCLTKEARSDEKIRFTENEMTSIVRTILFMYVFRTSPKETLLEIINTGEVSHNPLPYNRNAFHEITITEIICLFDYLFGDRLSSVVSRPIGAILKEYNDQWRYFPLNRNNIKTPSCQDYQLLAKFVNLSTPTFSPPSIWI